MRVAYAVAMLFNLFASFYVFMFGICGPPEQRADGGYACLATGQSEELTAKWIRSLIVFTTMAILITRPGTILVGSIMVPAAALARVKGKLHDKTDEADEADDLDSQEVVAGAEEARVNPLVEPSPAAP